jgi:transcriptional regulator of acetoin/glycerol metabolism
MGNAITELSRVHRLGSGAKGRGLISRAGELSDSWWRCTVEHHINPNTRRAPHIITESELRAYREPVGDIIFCAQEEINRLYATVRQEGYVVLFSTVEGITVHHRGDEGKAEQFKYWGIWEGGVWAEKTEGTNGIGTCISEQRPVIVHAGQHFRARHAALSCVAVPIFDARGVLAAVLDTSCVVTARTDQSRALALAATTVSARMVEERLFRESFRHSWNLAAIPCDDSGSAVLLAVDNDQRVVGADRVARLAFALNDRSLSGGVPLSMLFEYDPRLFRNNNRQDIPAQWMRAGCGGWWYVLITPPLSMWKG